ncbi:pimeloyl-ACP methyl ester carboxylesterase [Nocardia tenerifensis]|uniref:Pimeloyl-ACP methyl ester carboxylesterase n=1 Tax=Nocardia tenerifensis TaxID=228006 RepID=A0A318K2Q8_9NOCA|nr:alpha/beta hydrolase [Nocardia tenerifensis]PXX65339.1 pimeloyl-ACP methyl ester carboxylesterase [Nocardia tenerifensis]
MNAGKMPQLPIYDHRVGAGPTLVFLHYWGGTARTWQPVLDRLPGRATLTLDARGWGRSRELPGPYSLEQLARDTRDVIAAAGVTDYVLVGHSMGGKVAQLVAAARPAGLVELVLVAPGPAKPAAFVTPEYREGLSHAYDSAETTAAALDTVLTATPLNAHLRAHVLADSRAGAPAARREWPLHGIAQDITAAAQNIAVPVLVVAGEQDRVEPVEVLRDNLLPYLSEADLRVIAGSGHLIPLEAPAALASLLLRVPAVTGATSNGGAS